MDVSKVGSYGQTAYETKVTGAKTEAAQLQEQTKAAEEKAVTYEKTSAAKAGKTDYDAISRLKKDLESRQAQLKSLVVSMLNKQGKTAKDALGGVPFQIDSMTQEEAQAAIGESGFWGVEQTSDRLVEFAKGLTGGDPALVEKMRDAIKKGFGQAGDAWGGKLPDICQQTYDATMKKLDEWANEGASDAG